MTTEMIHPFQKTLGEGPYRFVGDFSINLQAAQYGRPAVEKGAMHPNFKAGCGTCAHCGTAILNVFQVQIGNGDVYGVGCDCIERLGEWEPKLVSEIKKAVAKKNKERRIARATAQRLEIRDYLAAHAAELEATPKGSSNLLDYYRFVVRQCGAAGIAKWHRIIVKGVSK